MGESGSQQRREPGGHHDDADMIQFGGLPVRWPFGGMHMPHLPPAMRLRVTIALAALAAGLLVGFIGGRLTAHQPGHKTRSSSPVSAPAVIPQFASTVVALTSARCAVQVGNDLQLGVEIINETRRTVALGAIRPMFPLGGLRMVSSGIGPCGELPSTQIPPTALLSPGATTWIHITVAVRLTCPEPLPVWFRVSYASAGKTGVTVLAGFPDLGPVSYRHCQAAEQNTSAIIATVENGRGHSSSG
jgi:hypothetical protein